MKMHDTTTSSCSTTLTCVLNKDPEAICIMSIVWYNKGRSDHNETAPKTPLTLNALESVT